MVPVSTGSKARCACVLPPPGETDAAAAANPSLVYMPDDCHGEEGMKG